MQKKTLLLSSLLISAVSFLGSCQSTESQKAVTPEEHSAKYVEVLEPFECGSISRMHTINGVFLASQPQVADFEQAKMGGILTVVNQRPESEQTDFDERDAVEGLGLTYMNLGWNGPDQLTDEMLDRTREILRSAPRPMLMHCSSANRTGSTWFAYRVLDGGLSVEAAYAEAKMVGMRTPAYEAIVRDYIARRSGN